MWVNFLVFRVIGWYVWVYIGVGFPVIMIYTYVFCVVWWYCMNVFFIPIFIFGKIFLLKTEIVLFR